jgi:hypothetical protein
LIPLDENKSATTGRKPFNGVDGKIKAATARRSRGLAGQWVAAPAARRRGWRISPLAK